MQNISEFENEKEVLVLPFSCLEVKSIEDSFIETFGFIIPIKIITLNYLYKYKDEIYKYIENIKNDKEKMKSFLKNVINSKFSNEIVQLIKFDIEKEFKKLLEKKIVIEKKFLDFNIIQSLENCYNIISNNSKTISQIFDTFPSSITKILINGQEALNIVLLSGKKIIMQYFPDKDKIICYAFGKNCKDYDNPNKFIELDNKKIKLENCHFFEFYACGLAIGDFIANYDKIKDEPFIVKMQSFGSTCWSMMVPFLPYLAAEILPKAVFKKVPYALIAINACQFILDVKNIFFDKSLTKSETAIYILKQLLKALVHIGLNYIFGTITFKILVYTNFLPGSVIPIVSIGVGIGVSYLLTKIKNKFFSENDKVDDLILFSESTYNVYIPRMFREFCIPTLVWKGVSDKAKSFAIELVEDGYRKWLVINIKKWVRKISNDNYKDVGDTVFEYKGISKHPFKVCFILYECKKEIFKPEEWGIGEKINENYTEELSKNFNQVAELYLF